MGNKVLDSKASDSRVLDSRASDNKVLDKDKAEEVEGNSRRYRLIK